MKTFYLPLNDQKKHSLFATVILLLSLFIFLPAARASADSHLKKHRQKKEAAVNAPTISYATPQTYGVGQTISPLIPTSSGVAAAAYSTTMLTLGGSYNTQSGVAFDASGNMYLVASSGTAINERPVDGGPEITIAGGFTFPDALTVDKSGNVYVSDAGSGFTVAGGVYKILAGSHAVINLGTFNHPVGVAVDAAGDVYVGEGNSVDVKELKTDGTIVKVGSGYGTVTGIALDAAGYLYVADYFAAWVWRVSPDHSTTIKFGLGFGFQNPGQVAVDAAGDVYIGDQGSHLVQMIPSYSTCETCSGIVTIGTTGTPSGVTVDSKGNVYVVESTVGVIHEIVPAGGYYLGNALPAGLSFNGLTGAISGTPAALTPAADYMVTAYNSSGGTSTTVNITVQPPFVGLTALSVSDGKLSPAFAPATTTYTDSVTNATATVTITPTASPGSTVTINGTAVTSGSPTAAISLGIGSNPFNIVVTGSDGTTTKTYLLKVVWEPSSEAHLSALSVNSATLSPAFANNVFSYTSVVPASTASVTITPSLMGATGHITVNGSPVANNAASAAVALNAGPNTIKVVVTAQDNITILTYTIVITRQYDATLSSLFTSSGSISPAFASATTSYTEKFGNLGQSVTLTVTAVVTDPAATISVNGVVVASGTASQQITVASGTTTAINVVVTAPDGITTKTYTITVTKAATSDATLASINPGSGQLTPAFDANTNIYNISVAYAVASITVRPVTNDPNATMKVNGAPLTSGTTSPPVALVPGATANISVTVTAQDGVAKMTYSIAVTRALSNNALLTKIATNSGVALATVTGPDYKDYAITVPSSLSSITVTPTAQDAGATIKVNGTTVASGTASQPIPLPAGKTTINTVVTAQDGVTTKIYGITVTKLSNNALLTKLATNTGIALTQVTGADYRDYTLTVPATTNSIIITPVTQDATATIKINGAAVASGTASAAIALLW